MGRVGVGRKLKCSKTKLVAFKYFMQLSMQVCVGVQICLYAGCCWWWKEDSMEELIFLNT